jgi:hypothetical protein
MSSPTSFVEVFFLDGRFGSKVTGGLAEVIGLPEAGRRA